MPETASRFPSVRFGPFEVHLRSHELRKHGMRIRLSEQPFNILAMLLDHPGEVVTREEMRARLWPVDTFVDFEHSLNTAIKKLRHALNDSAEDSQCCRDRSPLGLPFHWPYRTVDRRIP